MDIFLFVLHIDPIAVLLSSSVHVCKFETDAKPQRNTFFDILK